MAKFEKFNPEEHRSQEENFEEVMAYFREKALQIDSATPRPDAPAPIRWEN